MGKTIAIIAVNLAILGAVAWRAIAAILNGCNIGGACTGSPSMLTWAMAIAPGVIAVAGGLFLAPRLLRSMKARQADRAEMKAMTPDEASEPAASDDDIVAAGSSRLQRLRASQDSAAAEAISPLEARIAALADEDNDGFDDGFGDEGDFGGDAASYDAAEDSDAEDGESAYPFASLTGTHVTEDAELDEEQDEPLELTLAEEDTPHSHGPQLGAWMDAEEPLETAASESAEEEGDASLSLRDFAFDSDHHERSNALNFGHDFDDEIAAVLPPLHGDVPVAEEEDLSWALDASSLHVNALSATAQDAPEPEAPQIADYDVPEYHVAEFHADDIVHSAEAELIEPEPADHGFALSADAAADLPPAPPAHWMAMDFDAPPPQLPQWEVSHYPASMIDIGGFARSVLGEISTDALGDYAGELHAWEAISIECGDAMLLEAADGQQFVDWANGLADHVAGQGQGGLITSLYDAVIALHTARVRGGDAADDAAVRAA